MAAPQLAEPEIFTIREVARAAGVPLRHVRALVRAGEAPFASKGFLAFADAAELVRMARRPETDTSHDRRLFAAHRAADGQRGLPFAASGALHALLFAAGLLIASLGTEARKAPDRAPDHVRLVFLTTPGPGGGGGGGGLRQPLPPPRAELKGTRKLRSPVSVAPKVERRAPDPPKPAPPAPVVAVERPAPPPPPAAAPVAPVAAPVATIAADPTDRAGVVTPAPASTASNGPGDEGGTGSGRGTGSGPGNGAGIGDGSIAGTGGGPYRPGSGVTPPTLISEVKPLYSEEARRRGIEGEVTLEVVIRANGRVGDIRVLRGLGAGLDQRAVDAVRQWTFLPAKHRGTPVDVVVEVAVDFRLR